MEQKKTDKFYNWFSWFYPLLDVFLMRQKKRLMEEVNFLPKAKLLEIGVGTGKHLKLYQNHEVTCIDISPGMLEKARQQNLPNIELIEMNGEDLKFHDQEFDVVVMSHIIAVVNDPAKVLSEVQRVLKPGGKLFILNHFTPPNALKYLDITFAFFCRWFHFKSVFYKDELPTGTDFSLEREVNFSRFGYFKLLIFSKKSEA